MILSYRSRTPAVDPSVYMSENATVIGNAVIEKDANVWFGAVIRADWNSIRIGEGSSIQDNASLHVSEGHPLTIGKYVTVGHNAVVHGATVGDGTIVGMQACVLDGAVIGENCIIGAGALVRENEVIPPNSLCVGVPARIVRTMTPEQAAKTAENAQKYVVLAKEYRAQQK